MADGEDIEAGRTTGENQTTILVGEASAFAAGDFHDDVFLVSTWNASGEKNPGHPTDGVYGVAYEGGFGVVGFGGGPRGTGIVGQGGWGRIAKAVAPLSWAEIGGRDKIQERTVGGIGVHGLGGNQEGQSIPAGSGIVGQGGKPDTSPTNEKISAGPGVVGIAGGLPVPDPNATRDTGVYGEGPTGVFAQGAPIPGGSGQSIGVVAKGAIGMQATGDRVGSIVRGIVAGEFLGDAIGLVAGSNKGRAALFSSARKHAQITLVAPDDTTVPPAEGNIGDLLLIGPTLNNRDVAVQLWLCTTTGSGADSPAFWQPVQLGPAIQGQG
jgi:hypothetical protein